MTKLKILSFIIVFLFVGFLAHGQEHFSRGFENNSFIQKGQWVTGVTASFSQSNQTNYQFLVVEGISGDGYSFKISPMVCYIFKDNLGAGGRFAYKRSLTKLDNANIIIDSDTNTDIDNLYSINQTYSAMAIFRNYISLGNSKRFGLFNEVQLELGTGNSKLSKGSGTDFTGTYSRSYSIDAGLAPGIIMFLNNYSAIEVNVGVLGFSYTHTKSITDQIYVANMNSKVANFKINLFSISFGVTFYL